jgi:myo-inositol 2-dehydrogenase/D-chiro-inositol 1-dehydrogenase
MKVEETRMIGEAAKRAGIIFQVGFNRRFDHNFRKIRDTVAAGSIGRPTIIHVISRDPTYDLGYIRRSIEEGGMFVDMTIHDFDMVQYVVGREDPIVEVFAWGASLVAPEDIGTLGDVDTAVVTLRTRSGVMATIDNTRKAGYGYDQRVEALGTKGMVACDNDRPTTCRTLLAEGNTEEDRIMWWFMERYPEAFIAELREFFELVRKGTGEPPVTCDDMMRAMLVANAANESLKTGLPMKVTQL